MSYFNDEFMYDDEDIFTEIKPTVESEAEKVLKRISDEQLTWKKTRSTNRDSQVQQLLDEKKLSDLETALLKKSIQVLELEKEALAKKLENAENKLKKQVIISDAEEEAMLQELDNYLNG